MGRARTRCGAAIGLGVLVSVTACRRGRIDLAYDDPWYDRGGSGSTAPSKPVPQHRIQGDVIASSWTLAESTWTSTQWPLADDVAESGYAVLYVSEAQAAIAYSGEDGGLRRVQVPSEVGWTARAKLEEQDLSRDGVVARVAIGPEQIHVLFGYQRLFVGVLDRSTGGWLSTRSFDRAPRLHWAGRSAHGWHLVAGVSGGPVRVGWLGDEATELPVLTRLSGSGDDWSDNARVVEDATGRPMVLTWMAEGDIGAFVADVQGEGTWLASDLKVAPRSPVPEVVAMDDGWTIVGPDIAYRGVASVDAQGSATRYEPWTGTPRGHVRVSDGTRFFPRAEIGWPTLVPARFRGEPMEPLRVYETGALPDAVYDLAAGELRMFPPMPAFGTELSKWNPHVYVDVQGKACLFGGHAWPDTGTVEVVGGACMDAQTLQWQWVGGDADVRGCEVVAYLDYGTAVRCGARRWEDAQSGCLVETVGVGEHPWRIEVVTLEDAAPSASISP